MKRARQQDTHGQERPEALVRIREMLSYDPETGIFRWLKTANSNGARQGQQAGYVREDGYVEIAVANRPYRAHRIAWAFVHGEWPQHLLDHINGDRSDNRIFNLRPATRATNLQNQTQPRSNNRSGYLGVCVATRCKLSGLPTAWRATIKHDGRQLHLGNFPSPLIAHAVYVKAKRYLHPACTL